MPDATTATTYERSGLHRRCEHLLISADQRYTRQRRSIVEALAGLARPVTVPEVLRAREAEVSQSSVYRNLGVLCDVGIVRRVGTIGEHDRFELSETIFGQHHHHVRCVECGLIIDLEAEPRFERAIAAEIGRVREALGFEIVDHTVDLVGRCGDCQRRGRER